MNKHDDANTETARPLARVLARELSQQEVAQVAGGNRGINTTGGITINDWDLDVIE